MHQLIYLVLFIAFVIYMVCSSSLTVSHFGVA